MEDGTSGSNPGAPLWRAHDRVWNKTVFPDCYKTLLECDRRTALSYLKEDVLSRQVIQQDKTANKHVYSITEKGRKHFEKWLREPVTKFEELKEPFVLKIFFFNKLSREEILWHLRSQLQLHYGFLEEFRGIRDNYEDRITAYQRLIGDVGVLYVEVRILWLARMIELVKKGEINKKHALYSEETVEIGKKFVEEIFSEKPSKEFRKWLRKVTPRISGSGQKDREDAVFSGSDKKSPG